MSDYRVVLKKVGVFLVIAGLIDIACMVYCISAGINYSSSFNIFAVVAGVLLWRGHLGATYLVTRLSAFLFAGGIGMCLLLAPSLKPAGLWAVEFRLNPASSIFLAVMTLGLLALLAWIYRQLRSSVVVSALQAAGRSASTPWLSFGLGAALSVLMAIIFHFVMGGSAAGKAIEMARLKYGSQYRYSLTSIQWSGNHTRATLSAYNDHEIKSVTLDWTD